MNAAHLAAEIIPDGYDVQGAIGRVSVSTRRWRSNTDRKTEIEQTFWDSIALRQYTTSYPSALPKTIAAHFKAALADAVAHSGRDWRYAL